jgi:hypothetical protein
MEIFINDPGIGVLLEQLVDRSVDLLLDPTAQALSGGRTRRGKLLLGHALLFQTRSQLRLVAAFLPIPDVALVPSCRESSHTPGSSRW